VFGEWPLLIAHPPSLGSNVCNNLFWVGCWLSPSPVAGRWGGFFVSTCVAQVVLGQRLTTRGGPAA
jgi:hypothetical protein